MSTADKLNALVQTKADIKQALIDKGQNPSDVFSTYADDIRAIETSSSGGVFDFASLGYTGNEEPLKSAMEYAKIVQDSNKGGSYRSDYIDDLNLVVYPKCEYIRKNYEYYFTGCKNLILIPKLDFVGSMKSCFSKCVSLTTIPDNDYSKVTNLRSTFNNCINLHSLGYIDCTSATDAAYIFQYCERLEYNPLINTENIQDWQSAFQNTNIKQIKISGNNITNFKNVFANCKSLIDADLSDCIISGSVEGALGNCNYITNIKTPDMTNATDCYQMFYNCYEIQKVPSLNTINSTRLNDIFSGCSKLVRVEGISLKSDTYHQRITLNGNSYFFGWENKDRNYFLIKDLGSQEDESKGWNFIKHKNWGIEVEGDDLTIGSRQSLIDSLITYSFDRVAAGYNPCSLTLHSTSKELLTEEEIAQITAKGYTLL